MDQKKVKEVLESEESQKRIDILNYLEKHLTQDEIAATLTSLIFVYAKEDIIEAKNIIDGIKLEYSTTTKEVDTYMNQLN